MSSRSTLLGTAGLFLAVFLVYLHTQNPVFQGDDSPETIAACVTLGIQHPPGYPLHTLLGRLASLNPLANPGWRVNSLAALAGALAVILCFLSIREVLNRILGRPRFASWAAGGAALCLAFCQPFWGQCLSAKGGIYTLQAVFLGLNLWLLVKMSLEPGDKRWFLWLCLANGLGLSSHWETQVLFFPALGLALWRVRPVISRSTALTGLLLAVAGLSVWCYLPLRSRLDPAVDWGHPASLRQFFWVLLRSQYTGMEAGFVGALKNALTGQGPFAAAWERWPPVAAQARRVVFNFATGLGPGLWCLSLAGLWDLKRRREKALFSFNLALWATFILLIIFYFSLEADSLWILDVFMLPLYFSQAFLAGLGFALAADGLWAAWESRRGALPAAGALALAAAACLSPGVIQCFVQSSRVDQKANFGPYDNGRNLLDSIQQDGLFLAEGDELIFSTCYFQEVEGRRLDIASLPSSHLSFPWGVGMLARRHPGLGLPADLPSRAGVESYYREVVDSLVRRQAGTRPLYTGLSHPMLQHFFQAWEPRWAVSGASLEFMAEAGAARPAVSLLSTLRQRLFLMPPVSPGIWENYDRSDLARAWLLTGLEAAGHAVPADSRPQNWYLRQAVHLVPSYDRAEFWNLWGLGMARLEKFDQALPAFRESALLKPGVKVLVSLSNVQLRTGSYPEAAASAKRALALDPNSQIAAYSLQQALNAIDKSGTSH